MPNARHRPDKELFKKLGENLRALRKERGLTQEELAELVDLNPRMIQTIEAGGSNILVTTAMRLVAALDCEWKELIPKIEAPKRRAKPSR